mgnify:FL=1
MVMKNNIGINEYNDLINESNIVKSEIEKLDKKIINSNDDIRLAKKNVKGALVAVGISFTTCVVAAALRAPMLVTFISGGMAAVSFNWTISAADYITIEKMKILDFSRSKMTFSEKQKELENKIINIEKTNKRDLEPSIVNESTNIKTKKKIKAKVKSINN